MSEPDSRSIAEVLAAIAGDLSDLVRTESELVRRELSEKVSGLVRAGMGMAAGAALLIGAYFCVLAAAVIGLSYFMPAAWAALLVGVVTGLIGFTLVRGAAKRTRPGELVPERGAQELRRNVQAMKETAR